MNDGNAIYGNVKECRIFFEDGDQKVFVSDNKKGSLTVSVLSHHVRAAGFVNTVLANYQKTDSLSELASKCGFNSMKTFTRYFKKNFHTTPKQWLLEIKKEEMIHKLKHTKLPIKQIAIELEFPNVSYLDKFCIQRTGKQPEEIRNEQ